MYQTLFLASLLSAAIAPADSARLEQNSILTAQADRGERLGTQSVRSVRDPAIHQGDARYYQLLSVGVAGLSSLLLLVAYLSHRRLRRANRELRERIASNNEGQQLQEELATRVTQAARMESLGALAGGIAHDFNNLLVGVLCNAEVLQKYHSQSPAAERCLDGILKAARAASDLSQKMLAYAGPEASEKRPADLNEIVGHVVSLARSGMVQSDIRFTPSTVAAVSDVDGTQVEQIILNLINNATEAFGERPGTVEVTIGHEQVAAGASDPYLFGPASAEGKFVFVEVQDNGPGIKGVDITRIFEPFQSSNNARGRGMGLAVVYSLVSQHNGLIRVRSCADSGTAFRILLPQSNSPPDVAVPAPETSALAPEGFVLFVDDEEIVGDVAARILGQVNWRVVNCRTGEDAIRFLEQSKEAPDCICLDLVMPEMSGSQVVERLHGMQNEIPVILMSGYSGTNPEPFLAHPPVKEFLAKPFNTGELIAAVSRVTSVAPDDERLPRGQCPN